MAEITSVWLPVDRQFVGFLSQLGCSRRQSIKTDWEARMQMIMQMIPIQGHHPFQTSVRQYEAFLIVTLQFMQDSSQFHPILKWGEVFTAYSSEWKANCIPETHALSTE